MIEFSTLSHYYPLLIAGARTSLRIAGLSCLLGSCIGTVLAFILASKSKPLKFVAHLYVTIIRGTPMLIQIAATFYLLKFAGIPISALASAIISIGLNSGAYVSQIMLSGIKSVSHGQIEACQMLGLSRLQTIRYIILPQTIRAVLPSLGNEFVTLIKDSSLASTIGVYELAKQGEIITSQTLDAPTVFFALAVIYLTMTTTLTILINYLDTKMNNHVNY